LWRGAFVSLLFHDSHAQASDAEALAATSYLLYRLGVRRGERLSILEKAPRNSVNPRNFFAELKRRKVYRVAIAYAVVGWLIIQIVTQVFPFLEIPGWTIRLIIILVVLGFPIALILAWAFDLTSTGIKRTDDRDRLTQPSQARGPASREPRPASAQEKSIAVLPFENLSDDQRNAYLADGIQDDILSSLAKVADLKVISRTSVRQYKTGTRNLREIGEDLGVAHILEGTVRREGNRVRINTQLINAETDLRIWNDTFDRELTDLFALQSELAERITSALRANLSPREKASLQVHPTADLDAYELFLRARDLFRWSGSGDPRENGERALRLLDEAVSRDPEFAVAYCLASRFHGELYWFGHDKSRSRLTQAKIAADKGMRFCPGCGDARLALAYYYYFGYRDYDLARTELAIAEIETPNDAEIWDAAGAIDRRQGRWEESLSNFEKARQLDPLNASVIWNLAETYACLGRHGDAKRTFAHGLNVHPGAHLFSLAEAAIDLKTSGDTASLATALRQVPPDFNPGGGVTIVALRTSLMKRDYEEAARVLRASRYDRYNDTGIGGPAAVFDGYAIPRTWFEGLIAQGQNEQEEARRSFVAAKTTVEGDLNHWPEDAKSLAMLGMIHAALGEKEEAMRLGRRAVEILPMSKDAYDGPLLATKLAVIYAQVGEPRLAQDLVADLIKRPNGLTGGALRAEPEWDSVRGLPWFQELAAG
jgi:TolB-like protein